MKKISTHIIIIFLALNSFSNEISNKLSLVYPIQIKNIDIKDLYFIEEWETYLAVYDTLIEYQNGSGFKPVLASKWYYDPKSKEFIFKLKSDLYFSDYSKITAEDVAFSLKRLIFFDKNNELTISRCLNSPNRNEFLPNDNFSKIKIVDQNIIKIGPTSCQEELLKDLAQASHGVTAERFTDKSFKIKNNSPSSGLYTINHNENTTILKANTYNWRIKNAIKNQNSLFNYNSLYPDIELIYKKPNELLNSFQNHSFFKTFSPEMLKLAKLNGYKTLVSLPNMTWFLAPADSDLPNSNIQNILKDLNINIKRNDIEYFKNNELEVPTDTFFPKEFNCDTHKDEKKINNLPKGFIRNKFTILIESHKSRESDAWLKDLESQIKKIGYNTLIIDNENKDLSKNKNYVTLKARRQFLGEGIFYSLSFAFLSAKTIPDYDGSFIKKLKKVSNDFEKMKNENQKNICKSIYQYNHIPIAHRSIAFVTKDEKYFNVFNKGDGNINLTKIGKKVD